MTTVEQDADAIGETKFDALPERVQDALGELAGAAKEGLLALSVGVGLGVLSELRPRRSMTSSVRRADTTPSVRRFVTATRPARSRSAGGECPSSARACEPRTAAVRWRWPPTRTSLTAIR